MTQCTPQIATIEAVGSLQQQLAMMQLLLQALTNGCDCAPCRSLRALAMILTAPPGDGTSATPNKGPTPLKTAPPQASDVVNHPQPPREGSLFGAQEEP